MKNKIRKILLKRIVCITAVLCIYIIHCKAQDRYTVLDQKLTEMAKTIPGIDQKVEISVNGVSIQEFMRGIATANNLDISVDPDLKISVVNSFSNSSVKDILLFLCKQYSLDVTFIGNIINLEKYSVVEVKKDTVALKKTDINYDTIGKTVSYNLSKDSLFTVLKELTVITGKNFILSPGLYKKAVSGYVKDMSLDDAMDMLAYSNNLKIKKTGDNYLFEDLETQTATDAKKTSGKSNSKSPNSKTGDTEANDITLTVDSVDNITIKAIDTPISDIIKTVSEKIGASYFFATDITGNTSIDLKSIKYDDLLENILSGTEFTYNTEGSFYLFGKRDMEGLRETRVIKLNYRSVDGISDFIPEAIKKAVTVKEFPELNSLIISGSKKAIAEIDSFIFDIDKIVPVVLIEVLIVESKKSHTVKTGVKAALTKNAVTTTGDLYPTTDLTLNSTSINNIINSINGFGLINIGKVTSQFFLTLQSMEDDGILKVNSTPKLATLNGNEATLSIGNTEYYLEETSNLIANASTQNITTKQYKSVNADLSLTIKPFVSGDDQITLTIEVKQSDFTARISPSAPPGSVTRNFSSVIRVKNEEMILLGGLEKKSNSSTGSGVPFLARIPVIKWFFSSEIRERSTSKLNIFIKSTVVY
jgi:type IV pilus assembly protein PilQ